MHIYFLQHSPLFGPARMADWLAGMGHSHNHCRLDEGELPPPLANCDALILLDAFSPPDATLFKRERKLLDRALRSNKPVLGIGFGAGLIAEALGSIVSPAVQPELGWQPLTLADESPFDLPETFEALLWHQDIFGLPDGSLPLGSTPAGPVQGFAWDLGRVVALQCHLELTARESAALYDHAPPPAGESPYVQSRDEILRDPKRFDRQAALLDRVMTQWLEDR
ncbi:glutamine amidotransferase [Salinicola sp. MH3R3-1]|uniref:type 1 glutamine amidotransferase n=1 Tax=Salinicola sp. MH3R3-1 TaxID=1928762 RepID=UPI00094F0C95|nr:type 1 glutamine amidotransferase [Salinicola sp. MH3R3-1]OLO06789.1 glutamine amidotransferase [Salinicola sp. MH3R3-1]